CPVRVFQNGDNKYPIVETDEFLIQFKPNVAKSQATALLAKYGAVLDSPLGPYAPNGYLAHVIDPGHTAMAVANALYGKPQVLFSHPNLIWPMSPRFVPNDPLYPQQWHLNNTGQGGGTPGADIKAEKAWDITRGDPNLIIADIDTGIDVDHEDLQANMLPGFDAIERDGDPRPKDVFETEDHGTVTAGLLGAVGNNGIGVTGVAPNCKILPIRLIVFGQTEQDTADAFRFAADSGAAVINNSWGPSNLLNGFVPIPDAIKRAIDYAVTKGRGGLGCVVVFAAAEDALFPGGGNADLDGYASYDKVISVVASSNLDTHAAFSDSGQSTDIAAPGGGGTLGIVSTDRMGADGYDGSNYTVGTEFEGTSASAPIVSGVAALILSVNPNLSYTQVRDILENTADKIDPSNASYDANGHSASLGYGRVNAYRAVSAASVKLPVLTLIKPENNDIVGGNVLLRATTDNDAAVRRVDFARRNEGGDASFSHTPSKPIPDRGTIVDSQPLSASGVVEQATVQVDITHTFPFDLVVSLVAPDGTQTTLFNHNPTFIVITPTGIGISINQSVPLQGKTIAGTWSLDVSDTVLDGEQGTLDDWALTFVSPWVTIGSATQPVNGEWTAIWNTGINTSTPPGVYAVRATAITSTANVEDIHHNVTVTPLGVTLFAPADNETVSGKYLMRARTTNDATVQRVDFSRRKPPFSFSQPVNQQLVDGTTTSSSFVVTGHPGHVGEASVTVNIHHSYVGDLRLTLVAPDGSRFVLQDQVGGNQQNLNTTYFNVPVVGKSLNGTWSLEVTDGQAIDFGTFISWGMTLAPEWVVIARDSDGASNGEWDALWNSDNTEPGVYDVRAVAVSSNGNAFDINNNVTVASRIYNISG
ncbi:MAG: S8 family serine peptidase, partial [Abitibacteriaceae bacterium]|nr:S8 family serine peptidase [Abditibacteriaceae bacterium]